MQMIPILKPILESFRTTNFVLELCLADMKEKDAKTRIRNGEGPSIAWQVGHLLDHRCKVLELLGTERESPYRAKYTATGASDGSDYPDIADYRRQWEEIYAEIEAAIGTGSAESLDRILQHQPHGEKTVLDSIMFLMWHEAYHVGAVGTIRKELGYPGPAELVIAKAAE
jgi:uncharacterized damage-inducible protein DinB